MDERPEPTVADEIAVGLVLHLDPDELERLGATYTCARQFRVQGGHFFVCVEVAPDSSRWVPLYSNAGPGRTLLEGVRSGHAKWTLATTYYHRAQVWMAPAQAIAGAAKVGGDLSRPEQRNRLRAEDAPRL